MNRFQAAIVADYGMGDYAHIDNAEEAMSDNHGDTLFTFLMREMNEATDAADAIRMLENAIGDIKVAIASIENLEPEEPEPTLQDIDDMEMDLRRREREDDA